MASPQDPTPPPIQGQPAPEPFPSMQAKKGGTMRTPSNISVIGFGCLIQGCIVVGTVCLMILTAIAFTFFWFGIDVVIQPGHF